MPLFPGQNNQSRNTAELMSAYRAKGKIGNTKPKNKAHALKIAIAISSEKAKQTT